MQPVYFLLHVGGVAAAAVGEEQAAVAQTVHVDLDVRAVHYDHVGGGRLTCYLQQQQQQHHHHHHTHRDYKMLTECIYLITLDKKC